MGVRQRQRLDSFLNPARAITQVGVLSFICQMMGRVWGGGGGGGGGGGRFPSYRVQDGPRGEGFT